MLIYSTFLKNNSNLPEKLSPGSFVNPGASPGDVGGDVRTVSVSIASLKVPAGLEIAGEIE